ncbi:hypothetical protein [Pseudoxanthomonas winnipegensis]|uniref:hypothetical protein n=1 Tax=Pseudoxanthomonas winnipegensis TaxID=2480810 RepID=UPI00102DF4EC|nr:hypothetical protein [Pseudoxanthomonas winnipegensis]RZZ85669.1 hypothetical protein EA663_11705 [Pseudoxanthomonas winnipegensis]
MKNGDMPANPVDGVKVIGLGMKGEHIEIQLGLGLSKRELFAAMAMQGYCSVHEGWDQPTHEVARCSVAIADALLAELEKSR